MKRFALGLAAVIAVQILTSRIEAVPPQETVYHFAQMPNPYPATGIALPTDEEAKILKVNGTVVAVYCPPVPRDQASQFPITPACYAVVR